MRGVLDGGVMNRCEDIVAVALVDHVGASGHERQGVTIGSVGDDPHVGLQRADRSIGGWDDFHFGDNGGLLVQVDGYTRPGGLYIKVRADGQRAGATRDQGQDHKKDQEQERG